MGLFTKILFESWPNMQDINDKIIFRIIPNTVDMYKLYYSK